MSLSYPYQLSKSPKVNRWAFSLLSSCFGAILPLGFAPFHHWYLVIISLLGWRILLDKTTPKEAFRRGWWYGFGLFTLGVCWVYISINTYGGAPPWLAVIATLLFSGFLAILFALQAYIYNKFKFYSLPLLGFSALWVLFEWVRLWIFTGFPWLYIGYAFIDTPLAGYAPMGGVFLMSFMICISAECLFLLAKKIVKHQDSCATALKNRTVLFCSTIIASSWLVGSYLSTIEWSDKIETSAFKVSLVQGNVAQKNKWREEKREWTKSMYRELTLNEWATYQPDIVLWPEAAIPTFYKNSGEYFQEMRTMAVNQDSSLITGILYKGEDTTPAKTYNGVFSFDDQIQSYAKQRLVPFGEYIPILKGLSNVLPFLNKLAKFGTSPGHADQQGLKIRGYLFSPSICYEVMYPNLVQKYGRNAGILFTISNDAWFGRSHGPPQHFQMARMRALELDRYMLRSTNNGITAIIDNKGKVVKQLATDKRAVLRGKVMPAEGMTPFGYWGILPIISISGLLCLWVIARKILNQLTN